MKTILTILTVLSMAMAFAYSSTAQASCSGNNNLEHEAFEKKVLQLINNYRKNKPQLSECKTLAAAAQRHTNDMRDKNTMPTKEKMDLNSGKELVTLVTRLVADHLLGWERLLLVGHQHLRPPFRCGKTPLVTML